MKKLFMGLVFGVMVRSALACSCYSFKGIGDGYVPWDCRMCDESVSQYVVFDLKTVTKIVKQDTPDDKPSSSYITTKYDNSWLVVDAEGNAVHIFVEENLEDEWRELYFADGLIMQGLLAETKTEYNQCNDPLDCRFVASTIIGFMPGAGFMLGREGYRYGYHMSLLGKGRWTGKYIAASNPDECNILSSETIHLSMQGAASPNEKIERDGNYAQISISARYNQKLSCKMNAAEVESGVFGSGAAILEEYIAKRTKLSIDDVRHTIYSDAAPCPYIFEDPETRADDNPALLAPETPSATNLPPMCPPPPVFTNLPPVCPPPLVTNLPPPISISLPSPIVTGNYSTVLYEAPPKRAIEKN